MYFQSKLKVLRSRGTNDVLVSPSSSARENQVPAYSEAETEFALPPPFSYIQFLNRLDEVHPH